MIEKNSNQQGKRSGSKSPSNSTNGPDEAELKLLRARFRNRYQRFSSAVTKQSANQCVKGGQIRVNARKRRPKTPERSSQPAVDDGLTPTVFEEVKGGLKPAKTKLRNHDIFRKPPKNAPKEKGSNSEKSIKKAKPVKEKHRDKSTGSDSSTKEGKPKSAVKEGKSKEKVPTHVSGKKQNIERKEKESDKIIERPVITPPNADKGLPDSVKTPPLAAVSPSVESNEEKVGAKKTTRIKGNGQLGEYKAKPSLFERMEDEIILDDRVLQDIASDIEKGVQHNPELIDKSLASQLVEIKKNQEIVTDADLKEFTDEPFEVNETANRIVEALTSHDVLGQVLDASELKILSEYFNGIRQQDDAFLTVLNVALEKILDRANEFYVDRKELKSFLENRDQAKMLLLDALLSRKSGFLSQLYSNAFYYADVLRNTVSTAYSSVSSACVMANAVAGQSVAAASDGVVLVASAISRSTEAAKEVAQKGQEYVTTAKEVGKGIMGGATAAADYARSWTNLSTTGQQPSEESNSNTNKNLPNSNNLKQATSKPTEQKEHWLKTLWHVISTLGHLPYAFLEGSEEEANAASRSNENANAVSKSIEKPHESK